jgi:hypothetical protein
MARLSHGRIVTTSALQAAQQTQAEQQERVARSATAELAAEAPPELHDFDFLFPDLQEDPANLLEESADTVAALKQLSFAMVDMNRRDGGHEPSG